MDDWNVENNMNFTLNFDMNENETFASGNNVDFTQQAFTSGWKTGMRISYSFSRNVTGGIIYEYRESNSKTTGRKIDRDFGFDINIAISG
jgi:opacity protein-like surface antigen